MNAQDDLLPSGSAPPRAATLLLSLLLSLFLVAAARPALADDAGEVWLVSTQGRRFAATWRRAAQIEYWRLGPDHCWQPADAAAFHQGDRPGTPTTVFIHGNRIEPDEAVEEGWPVYQQMQQSAAGRPFRLVLWSWASQRAVRGVRADVLVKLDFSDAQSYYLARFLGELKADVPVSLVGYSLGARAATGALVLLSGGSIADRCLPAAVVAQQAQGHPRPLRVVLVAAACDADWLLPGHRDGLALGLVQRMLVAANPCDRVLKHYPRLYGRGGPEAMGAVGAYCCPQPGGCDKIETLDVACSVGPRHDWYRYIAAPELLERLGWYTFLEPAGVQSTAMQPRSRP